MLPILGCILLDTFFENMPVQMPPRKKQEGSPVVFSSLSVSKKKATEGQKKRFAEGTSDLEVGH